MSPLHARAWIVSGGTPADRLAWAEALAAAGAHVAVTGQDQAWLQAAQASVDLALTLQPGDARSAEVAVQCVVDRRGGLGGVLHLAPAVPDPPKAAELAAALAAAVVPCRALDGAAAPHLAEGRVVYLLPAGGSPEAAAVAAARRAWAERGLPPAVRHGCCVADPGDLAALLDHPPPPAGRRARLAAAARRAAQRVTGRAGEG